MVQSIPQLENKRVLEVGCGTGAFTKEILKKLDSGDEFHIVELSKEFCDAIEVSQLKTFRADNPKINIVLHNAPIEEANLEGRFDAIICGLPFNNFPINVVDHLFVVMIGHLRKNCELAYFEYLGMRTIKRIFGLPKVRRETIERTKNINERYEKQSGTQKTVWRNIPSCRVIRLKGC